MSKVVMMLWIGVFALTGSVFAQNPPAPAAPAAAVSEKPKAVHHQRGGELRKALHKLKAAKQDLEKAAREYGGHKAKAIEAISHAIEELTTALESEKK